MIEVIYIIAVLIKAIVAFIILPILIVNIYKEEAENRREEERCAKFLYSLNHETEGSILDVEIPEAESIKEEPESEEIINERSTEGSF